MLNKAAKRAFCLLCLSALPEGSVSSIYKNYVFRYTSIILPVVHRSAVLWADPVSRSSAREVFADGPFRQQVNVSNVDLVAHAHVVLIQY